MLVKINVGGKLFVTTEATLNEAGRDNLLLRMSQSSIPQETMGDAIFLDRDPSVFKKVLAYVRSKNTELLTDDVLAELDYLNFDVPKHRTAMDEILDLLFVWRSSRFRIDNLPCFAMEIGSEMYLTGEDSTAETKIPLLKKLLYERLSELEERFCEANHRDHFEIICKPMGPVRFWLLPY